MSLTLVSSWFSIIFSRLIEKLAMALNTNYDDSFIRLQSSIRLHSAEVDVSIDDSGPAPTGSNHDPKKLALMGKRISNHQLKLMLEKLLKAQKP